jgi:hypothetical protein
MNALNPATVVAISSVLGLVGGVLIRLGLKGWR